MAEGTTKKFDVKSAAKGVVADVKAAKTSTKVVCAGATVVVGVLGGVIGHMIPKKDKKAKK